MSLVPTIVTSITPAAGDLQSLASTDTCTDKYICIYPHTHISNKMKITKKNFFRIKSILKQKLKHSYIRNRVNESGTLVQSQSTKAWPKVHAQNLAKKQGIGYMLIVLVPGKRRQPDPGSC